MHNYRRGAARRFDQMDDTRLTAKDPLPTVPGFDPRTGLIAADERALCNLLGGLLGLRLGGCARAAQDAVEAALTHFDAPQVAQRLAEACVAQMLFLFVVDDRRFQPRPELAGRLQALRHGAALQCMAMRAFDLVRPRLYDQGADDRQFGQLMADDLFDGGRFVALRRRADLCDNWCSARQWLR